MRIESNNDRLIMIAAFRYGLGRMTYIVGVIVEEIIRNWDSLHQSDQKLIHEEIAEAIAKGHAGHGCDVDEWKKILICEVKE